MQNWSDKFSLLVITLWVGALWAIGYLAAPVLFYALDDKQVSGMLAGKMFTLVAYVGIASGVYLLIQRLARNGMLALKQLFFWVVFLMLLLALISHFGIQPIIAQLKAKALPADVMSSVFASRFKTWHGVASIAYLVQSLLGVVLVQKANR
jgi:hypothetical protein